MTTVAAIDGGKSGLRLAVRGPGGTTYGAGPGFGYRAGQDDVDAILAAVRTARGELAGSPAVDRLCAGLTGAPGERSEYDRLVAELGALFGGCPVDICGDSLVAHAGALAGPGVVVCAGTGTTVLAVAGDGRHAGVDAWGPWIGDRGSGWAVGLAGLRAAAAAYDGVGPPTSLADAMGVLLGGIDLAGLQRLYRDPAATARVAAFAEQVAAAALAGDGVAAGIWADAGRDLAASAVAAAGRLGLTGTDARVSWAGRVFAAGELVLAPLRAGLRDAGLRLVEPAGDALDGGLLLAAAGRESAYRTLLDDPTGSWR